MSHLEEGRPMNDAELEAYKIEKWKELDAALKAAKAREREERRKQKEQQSK